MESIRLSTTLPATPQEVYDSWLSSEGHTKMTGSVATVENRKSGRFTAWDGYITGTHLALDAGRRIVQAWRTTEFPGSNPDSKLEIRFVRAPRGCRLVLLQSDIPDGQGEMYTEGWEQHYFEPMNEYFSTLPRVQQKKKEKKGKSANASAKKRAVKKAAPRKKAAAPRNAAAKTAPKKASKAAKANNASKASKASKAKKRR